MVDTSLRFQGEVKCQEKVSLFSRMSLVFLFIFFSTESYFALDAHSKEI